MSFVNIAAYRFTVLESPDDWVAPLRERAEAASLVGTVLLAREGINLALAGPASGVASFTKWLAATDPFTEIPFKRSESATQPFRRLKVRVKDEIIRFGVPVRPQDERAPAISPTELKRWLDEGRDVLLLDARNRQEVARGSFANANHLDIGRFGEFPSALAQWASDENREREIVTFCTGGIRCEKSALYMEDLGFTNVRQLEGGILDYFEQHGADHFDGECFVFDDRLALDGDLSPAHDPAAEE